MSVSNRICPQCEASLAPNEIFCSNCGTRYTELTSVESLPDASPYQVEPTHYAGQALSSSSNVGSPNADYAPSPLSNVGYTPYGGQLLPLRSFPRSLRRPNIGLFIGMGLLVFLLVGGSIFFFVHTKSDISSNTPPTSSNAGPRALFSDNFANNSKAWDTGSGNGFSSIISGHGMVLSEANHKILDEPIPGDDTTTANYSDFSATSTFTITQADQNDSVGFYMRGDDNLSQGYFVDIFGDNTYDIVKVFPDAQQDTFLISPTGSSAINPVGQQNKLTVIMKGPKIVILINDAVVNSISDSAYMRGQLALFVENGKSSDGVKATFNDVIVYSAPAQLPG
jgi:hypothetical protein